MNNMKKMIAMALMLCIVLGLCACGAAEAEPTAEPTEAVVTEAPTEAPEETAAPEDDGMTTYTVTVVDEGGNPIAGAMVQICLETCYPAVTNESGVAEYSVVEADYKVSFLSLPAGYDYADETQEFYFDAGSTEMTITLKAVA